MENNDIKSYLEANPRMIGVLFTMILLLAQAGNAAAASCGVLSGP